MVVGFVKMLEKKIFMNFLLLNIAWTMAFCLEPYTKKIDSWLNFEMLTAQIPLQLILGTDFPRQETSCFPGKFAST
jgi:hypothetical protein